MKINKHLVKLAIVFAVLLSLTISVSAQRRKRKPPAKPKVVVTKVNLKPGAEKVSIQIKNVTKFLYTLGGIARGIEDIDKGVKAGKVSREIADKNEQFKRDVIRSLQNLRAGLVTLESDFRIQNELKPFITQIQGISNLTATAEDQARGGQFTESGKTLLFVVEKLADTLAAMP